jgi:S1-C subfamily serine protease
LLAACALAVAACQSAPPPPPDPKLPAAEVFETAKPAVVLVETVASVTWSVPQPEIDKKKQGQLNDRLAALVRSGSVAPTQAAFNRAALQIVTDDPDAWYTLTGPRSEYTDTDYLTGTGFFVTEDGYLLTNAHVVRASEDEIKQMLIAGVRSQAAGRAFLQTVRDGLSRAFETPVSDEQAGKLAQWLATAYASNLQVLSVSPSYRIGFGSHSPRELRDQGVPVRVVAQGDSVPGKDVAVLKADGGPFVTLPLARQPPARGAHLDVVGYPCGCRDPEEADPDRTLVATLTEGSAQVEVPMPGGWRATGTDAAMQHGNSGGPVLDATGHVVGLATFRDVWAAGLSSQASNFIVPVDVAREFTDQAGVRPNQGPLGRKYAQAVVEYDHRHYRAALPLFEQVAGAERQNPYVAAYVDQSRAAIAAGRDRTPPPPPGYVAWLTRYGAFLLLALWLLGMGTAAVLVLRTLTRAATSRR